MLIRLDPGEPLGQQICEQLSRAIRDGDLEPGTRLPSTRRLAEELGVSRNTILYAYDRLLVEGYVEGRRGAGTFVSSDLPRQELNATDRPRRTRRRQTSSSPRISSYARRIARFGYIHPPREDLGGQALRYDFRQGFVLNDRTSVRAWNQILRQQANRIEALEPPPDLPVTPGPLQHALAGYLHRTRGVMANPEQVIIVTGPQQAYQLTAQLLLDAGDTVVIENPHYVGARNSFLSSGARLIPVPVDRRGLMVESIPRSASGAKLAYVVPSQQWPTGVVMPLARRLDLLRWATDNDTLVIEDDCNCEYQHAGPPIQSLQGIDQASRVLYGGTMMRLFRPLHPLGYLVVPESLLDSYLAMDALTSFQPSVFEQSVLAEFITQGHFERLIRRARRRNAPVLASLRDAIDTHLSPFAEVFPAPAGFHVYVRLHHVTPEQSDELVRRAARAGVGLFPDHPLHLHPAERLGLIFSIGRLTETMVREGVRRLATILASWPRR